MERTLMKSLKTKEDVIDYLDEVVAIYMNGEECPPYPDGYLTLLQIIRGNGDDIIESGSLDLEIDSSKRAINFLTKLKEYVYNEYWDPPENMEQYVLWENAYRTVMTNIEDYGHNIFRAMKSPLKIGDRVRFNGDLQVMTIVRILDYNHGYSAELNDVDCLYFNDKSGEYSYQQFPKHLLEKI